VGLKGAGLKAGAGVNTGAGVNAGAGLNTGVGAGVGAELPNTKAPEVLVEGGSGAAVGAKKLNPWLGRVEVVIVVVASAIISEWSVIGALCPNANGAGASLAIASEGAANTNGDFTLTASDFGKVPMVGAEPKENGEEAGAEEVFAAENKLGPLCMKVNEGVTGAMAMAASIGASAGIGAEVDTGAGAAGVITGVAVVMGAEVEDANAKGGVVVE
jgi:hypothetical protein